MNEVISKQIQELYEIQQKCTNISGFYCSIDTAIAALQICSTYGLDETARMISHIKSMKDISNSTELRERLLLTYNYNESNSENEELKNSEIGSD